MTADITPIVLVVVPAAPPENLIEAMVHEVYDAVHHDAEDPNASATFDLEDDDGHDLWMNAMREAVKTLTGGAPVAYYSTDGDEIDAETRLEIANVKIADLVHAANDLLHIRSLPSTETAGPERTKAWSALRQAIAQTKPSTRPLAGAHHHNTGDSTRRARLNSDPIEDHGNCGACRPPAAG